MKISLLNRTLIMLAMAMPFSTLPLVAQMSKSRVTSKYESLKNTPFIPNGEVKKIK